jgi:hypothetical protein
MNEQDVTSIIAAEQIFNGLDSPGFEFLQDIKFSLLQDRPHRLCGPLSLLFNAHQHSFPEVNRPGPEVDHYSPSSTEVKNEWISIPAL